MRVSGIDAFRKCASKISFFKIREPWYRSRERENFVTDSFEDYGEISRFAKPYACSCSPRQ